mmetsp:Transcript_25880/g.69909  ORF Transcript_25880/g.69909 Transcript_25880/m.69909 type:complete len:208 (+) Transcript_25880:885-1508(+)
MTLTPDRRGRGIADSQKPERRRAKARLARGPRDDREAPCCCGRLPAFPFPAAAESSHVGLQPNVSGWNGSWERGGSSTLWKGRRCAPRPRAGRLARAYCGPLGCWASGTTASVSSRLHVCTGRSLCVRRGSGHGLHVGSNSASALRGAGQEEEHQGRVRRKRRGRPEGLRGGLAASPRAMSMHDGRLAQPAPPPLRSSLLLACCKLN